MCILSDITNVHRGKMVKEQLALYFLPKFMFYFMKLVKKQ